MTTKRSPVFFSGQEKIGVTPSVAAPGNIHPSDATRHWKGELGTSENGDKWRGWEERKGREGMIYGLHTDTCAVICLRHAHNRLVVYV